MSSILRFLFGQKNEKNDDSEDEEEEDDESSCDEEHIISSNKDLKDICTEENKVSIEINNFEFFFAFKVNRH